MFVMLVNDTVFAVSDEKKLMKRYIKMKGVGNLVKVPTSLDHVLMNHFDRLVLEDTIYGIPLTVAESNYMDMVCGDITETSQDLCRNIRALLCVVTDKDERDILKDALDVARDYKDSQYTFNELKMKSFISYVKSVDNPIHEIIEETNHYNKIIIDWSEINE